MNLLEETRTYWRKEDAINRQWAKEHIPFFQKIYLKFLVADEMAMIKKTRYTANLIHRLSST